MATVGGFLLGSAGAATAGAAATATIGTMAVVGGVSAVGSLYSSHKARSQQRKAQDLQTKQAKLQAGRAAVERVRQGQIARASILQQGENQEAGGSTAVAGSAGAIQSQVGGNNAFAQKIFGLQESASKLMQSANQWQGISDIIFSNMINILPFR